MQQAHVDADRQVAAMPPFRRIAHRAGVTALLASVVPSALFFVVMSLSGVRLAVIVTSAWYVAVLAVRRLRKERMVGAVALGAALMATRAVIAFCTASAFVYFIQPVAGTVVTAAAFAITAAYGRPIMDRLVHDFVPLPSRLSEQLRESRFFTHLSVMWTAMYLVNAAGTLWLLLAAPLGWFLLVKTALTPVMAAIAVGVSYLLFRQTLRARGIQLRWRQTMEETTPATGR